MTDSSSGIRPEFDPVALPHLLERLARYPDPPWLHTEVASRMAQRLPLIRLQPEHVIQWWAGLGASAELLGKAYPRAHQTWVEPSAEWLTRSRSLQPAWWRRLPWARADRRLVVESDLEGLSGAQLLWANMMLHWVADPSILMARWRQALTVDGFVMFSCFGPDTLKELRALYAANGWGSPQPSFVDMHDLGDMLVQSGFADPVMDQESLTISWPDPGAMLAELRQLGGNVGRQRFPGLRTPRWHRQLCEGLMESRQVAGRISMTFEIIYGHAFKALPKVSLAGETTISLGDMRAMVRRARATDGG